MSDNILDSLDPKEMMKEMLNLEIDDSPALPETCRTCKNAIICSVLPTIISIHRIGIVLGVESCHFKTQILLQKK